MKNNRVQIGIIVMVITRQKVACWLVQFCAIKNKLNPFILIEAHHTDPVVTFSGMVTAYSVTWNTGGLSFTSVTYTVTFTEENRGFCPGDTS